MPTTSQLVPPWSPLHPAAAELGVAARLDAAECAPPFVCPACPAGGVGSSSRRCVVSMPDRGWHASHRIASAARVVTGLWAGHRAPSRLSGLPAWFGLDGPIRYPGSRWRQTAQASEACLLRLNRAHLSWHLAPKLRPSGGPSSAASGSPPAGLARPGLEQRDRRDALAVLRHPLTFSLVRSAHRGAEQQGSATDFHRPASKCRPNLSSRSFGRASRHASLQSSCSPRDTAAAADMPWFCPALPGSARGPARHSGSSRI